MENNIKLNKSDGFDLQKLIDSRLLVQANSGGGKSWAVRRILEQSHGKVQQIVIDPEGEFGTLREKYDYLLVGKEGDISLSPKSAALLAHKILELGIDTIIDLYELPPPARKHFVRLFLDAMVNAPKELWHSCLVVIDEAHVFAPEKGESEASGSVIDLATRGRKRGYCVVLATQRISKLNKDAAAECNNKLIGRATQDIDRKRAADELGFTSKEEILSLRNLAPGEFYSFGPAISDDVKKISIGEVVTTHPKAGSRNLIKTVPPTAAIKAALKKLTDLPQEAEKELKTVAQLKAEILSLKTANNTFARNAIKNPVDDVVLRRGFEEARKIDARRISQLDTRNRQLELKIQEWQDWGDKIKIPQMPKKAFKHIPMLFMALQKEPDLKINPSVVPITKEINGINWEGGDNLKITGGALRMIKVLVSRYPMQITRSVLATFSKMKPSGGSFGTYLSSLRSAGLIDVEGDLISANQAGLDFVGEAPNPPQTSEEMIRMWQGELTGGARRMFDVLVEVYPQYLDKSELGERAGVEPSGGSFGTYLSILRSNGLVVQDREGNIQLSESLFI